MVHISWVLSAVFCMQGFYHLFSYIFAGADDPFGIKMTANRRRSHFDNNISFSPTNGDLHDMVAAICEPRLLGLLKRKDGGMFFQKIKIN